MTVSFSLDAGRRSASWCLLPELEIAVDQSENGADFFLKGFRSQIECVHAHHNTSQELTARLGMPEVRIADVTSLELLSRHGKLF